MSVRPYTGALETYQQLHSPKGMIHTPSNYALLIAPQLGCDVERIYPIDAEILASLNLYGSHAVIMAALSSGRQQPCDVQKTAFHSLALHP